MRDIPQKALEWIVGGDTGISSENIWAVMVGGHGKRRNGFNNFHPSDPADFGRCARLLTLVPEWRPRMDEMRILSKEWSALVDHWDEVESCMREEVGIDWSKGRAAPKTYNLIKRVFALAGMPA